jgi:capsular exopolysaccharide synthesis family protein
MLDGEPRAIPAPSWLRPRVESQGAIRYLATIRARWWLIVLSTVLAVLAAAVYVAVAPERYEASADLLVTPVSSDDASTAGLGLITQSNDPTQVVSTAARLVASPAVAQAVKTKLRLAESPDRVLGDVTAEPVAQSSLIAVRARAASAAAAARLANAFAAAAVEVRTRQLHDEIASQLPLLRQRVSALPPEEQSGPGTLGERVADLQALESAPDPTLRAATPATAPTSPVSPRKKLALIAGFLGGLILGVGAAFASQALDPRLQREEQLRELFQLPLLTRIPRLPNTRDAGPLPPGRQTPAATEAYRTLRATLAATVGEGHRSILITSSSPGEGKTTAAINFADALAVAGHRVILIEGDLRRPTIARALGIQPVVGIGAVLVNHASLEKAIVTTPEYGRNLGFLLVEHSAASLADRLSLPTARQLVAEAEANADYVVIDSPPLTEVIDALPVAQEVDAVLIMARIGRSRLNRLALLGEILAQGGVRPAGMVVIGRDRAAEAAYHTGRHVAEAPVA